MITVNELFSGIGSQSAALKRLGLDFKVVGIAEIDKYAIKSYEAIHGPVRNYGDISKIEKLDYADFWTYSFPCQDISVAGKQAGIEKGKTRSGLLYEVERLLEKSKECGELPKYLMLENVKNLVGKKFKPQFDEWISRLDELGYNTYWEVLNAKNYGIPQNRERVFAISILKEIDIGYEFPKAFDNGKRLKDILEKDVDEKYYISNAAIKRLYNNGIGYHSIIQKHEEAEISSTLFASMDRPARGCNLIADESIGIDKSCNNPRFIEYANCLTAREDRGISNHKSEGTAVLIPQATKQGYIECNIPGVADLSFPDSKTRRGRVQENGNICPTLMAGQQDICYMEPQFRIRKLTPLECWRLMGFTDDQFYKAEKVNSNSQLYKQAGNSIVVDVLYYLFKNLFVDKPIGKQITETDQLQGQMSIMDFIGG